jgi:hypothetical protein
MAFLERHLNTAAGADEFGAGVVKPRPYTVGRMRILVGARLVRAREHLAIPFALLAVLVFTFLEPATRAQPEAPPATFRTLAFGADVSEVFYDLHGKSVPIAAAAAGLSMPYEVPAGGRVVFYRLQPAETPEGKPRRVNVADADLGGSGPFLVFMAARPESPGGTWIQVVGDSWEIHPVDTIRLFNFSRRNVAVKIVIKDLVAELAPGEERILPYVAKGQFWLQAATKEAGGWIMRVSAPQVAPPTARITAIMFDQQPTPDRPVTHELDLVKYLDVAPPPAP